MVCCTFGLDVPTKISRIYPTQVIDDNMDELEDLLEEIDDRVEVRLGLIRYHLV